MSWTERCVGRSCRGPQGLPQDPPPLSLGADFSGYLTYDPSGHETQPSAVPRTGCPDIWEERGSKMKANHRNDSASRDRAQQDALPGPACCGDSANGSDPQSHLKLRAACEDLFPPQISELQTLYVSPVLSTVGVIKTKQVNPVCDLPSSVPQQLVCRSN